MGQGEQAPREDGRVSQALMQVQGEVSCEGEERPTEQEACHEQAPEVRVAPEAPAWGRHLGYGEGPRLASVVITKQGHAGRS